MTQATLFDFPDRPAVKKLRQRENIWQGEIYDRKVYRTDAEILVRDFGQLPHGGSLSDRLMRCTSPRSKDGSVLHWWPHVSGSFGKRIFPDGSVIDEVSTGETFGAIRTHTVTAYCIVGDRLEIDTEDGEFYCDILPDEEARKTGAYMNDFSPDVIREHLGILALSKGVPVPEVAEVLEGPEALSMCSRYHYGYDPLHVHDSEEDPIFKLADRLGVIPRLPYGPPSLQPEVYPIKRAAYCNNAKGCEQKKESGGCICCPRFLWNRKTISDKDWDSKSVKDRIPEKYRAYC